MRRISLDTAAHEVESASSRELRQIMTDRPTPYGIGRIHHVTPNGESRFLKR